VDTKVLGPGCKNCECLEMHAVLAVEQIQAENPKLEITVKKVTDLDTFLDYGLLKGRGKRTRRANYQCRN